MLRFPTHLSSMVLSVMVCLPALAWGTEPVVASDHAQTQACPLDFQVARSLPVAISSASSGKLPPSAQELRLYFGSAGSAVEMAEVTVTFLSTTPQVRPASSSRSDQFERHFHLQAETVAGLTASHLALKQFGSVVSVSVDRVSFADGSQWHSSQTSWCRAVPNNLMLVSQR